MLDLTLLYNISRNPVKYNKILQETNIYGEVFNCNFLTITFRFYKSTNTGHSSKTIEIFLRKPITFKISKIASISNAIHHGTHSISPNAHKQTLTAATTSDITLWPVSKQTGANKKNLQACASWSAVRICIFTRGRLCIHATDYLQETINCIYSPGPALPLGGGLCADRRKGTLFLKYVAGTKWGPRGNWDRLRLATVELIHFARKF